MGRKESNQPNKQANAPYCYCVHVIVYFELSAFSEIFLLLVESDSVLYLIQNAHWYWNQNVIL